MHILGVDPGLANCGWGVIAISNSSLSAVAYGNIPTRAKDTIPVRLGTIFNELRAVIERYRPVELGIETIYHKGNSKSALATAQARGAVLTAASTSDLVVGEYAPTVIKKSVVGTGSATKEQVQYMVRVILALDHIPSPDHAADALAAAICHAHWRSGKHE